MATASHMDIRYKKKGINLKMKVTGFTASGVLDRTNFNVLRGYLGNTMIDDVYYNANTISPYEEHVNPHYQTGDDALRIVNN